MGHSDTWCMTIQYLPSSLIRQLRESGLSVVEIPGWELRTRPASTGGFHPVGVLWHHTGGPQDSAEYASWLAKVGRPDLPAPLCQFSVSRNGTVYVIAGGRANHAGAAKASGSVAAGDGNELYIGVECMNTGSEGWSKAQYGAMVILGVVLGRYLGSSAQAQRAHRETSVTGKWDPGMLDMDKFRADISSQLEENPKQRKARVRMLPSSYSLGVRGQHVKWLTRKLNKAGVVVPVTEAYTESVQKAVKTFQKSQGWSGKQADGLPGAKTLELLDKL